MSSANRERRRQNREARAAAVEEAVRRARRQRITLAAVGLGLALVVAVVLVARATGDGGSSASSTTSTTVAAQPCAALSSPLPAGTPRIPIPVGPPPDKLLERDLEVGTGAVVKPGATVTVNYVGVTCSTGSIFDSTFGKQPFTTPLARVIPGWREGIPGMRVGGERLLGVPPDLAYGPEDPPGVIGSNDTLWFVVKVLKTK